MSPHEKVPHVLHSIASPLFFWNVRPKRYSKVELFKAEAYKVQKVLKLIATNGLTCNCDIISIFSLTSLKLCIKYKFIGQIVNNILFELNFTSRAWFVP